MEKGCYYSAVLPKLFVFRFGTVFPAALRNKIDSTLINRVDLLSLLNVLNFQLKCKNFNEMCNK